MFLNKQIGCSRFIYNKLLEIAKEKKIFNYYELKKRIIDLKNQYPFLKEANSQSLQEACQHEGIDTLLKTSSSLKNMPKIAALVAMVEYLF